MSHSSYDDCAFPLARNITFSFVMEDTGEVDENIRNEQLRVKTNIRAFVRRVKQMAPLAGKISVQLSGYYDMSRVGNQNFGELISRLYQLVSHVEYVDLQHMGETIPLRLDAVCRLTHVSCISGFGIGNVSQFVQLVRKNALTLQSLILECRQHINVLGLVQDAEGNHVVYPRLITLKVSLGSDIDGLKSPVFHGGAPFSTLRRLHIKLANPFNNDTFFRGNAATLELLDTELDSLSISMLRKYKVFVPGSHPKLQVVMIRYSDDYVSESFTSSADALQYMYNIGSGAAVRDFAQLRYLEEQVPTLSLLRCHEFIQVLSLPV
ncbi:hypothetical protein GGI03_000454 [Coemansia sp. RSA 2337]|nr:hypothetical protein GGI03_000454 [Coemansia sp. RSA 2337]